MTEGHLVQGNELVGRPRKLCELTRIILIIVCDSLESLKDETDYLKNVFGKNNNNTDFVRQNTHGNADSNNRHTKVNSKDLRIQN